MTTQITQLSKRESKAELKRRGRKGMGAYLLRSISCLRQFLAIAGPLKMMKNAFSFTAKALFVLKLFNFLS